MTRSRTGTAIVVAAVVAACGGRPSGSDGSVDVAPARWNCPNEWIPYVRGGCGPAVLLCAPGGGAVPGACDGIDTRHPRPIPDSDGGTTFYRGEDGGIRGAWPARDWVPDAGIARCPPGWGDRGDHGCAPQFSATCEIGAAALPGGACTPTGESSCPTTPYATLPVEAMGATIAHVRAGADSSTADGSETHPFATIAEGVTFAGANGWVRVAAGTYDARISLAGNTHIVGVCAARVTVRVTSPDQSALYASGASAVADVRGMTLEGGRPGVLIADGAHARLQNVRILRSTTHGVQVSGTGAQIELRDVVIREIASSPGGMMGRGVQIENGAAATLARLAIDAVRSRGVSASGLGTTVNIEDASIRSTVPGSELAAAFGVAALGGARLVATRVSIVDTTGIGVMCGSNSAIELHDAWINGSRPARANALASGIAVGAGSSVTGSQVTIGQNCCAGVLATQPRTRLVLEDSVVRDTVSDSNGTSGFGLQATAGALIVLRRTLVANNRDQGVDVLNPGSRATLEDVVVRDTRPQSDGTSGYGIEVAIGGALEAHRVVVERSGSAAVFVSDPGTTAQIDEARLGPTGDTSATGRGLSIQSGAVASMTRALVHDSRQVGIIAIGTDTALTLEDVSVTNTRTNPSNLGGHGLDVLDSAHVDLLRGLFAGNHEAGVVAAMNNASIDLRDVLIAGVEPSNLGGSGLVATATAFVIAHSVAVTNVRGIAIGSVPSRVEVGPPADSAIDLQDGFVRSTTTGAVRWEIRMGEPHVIDREVAYGLHAADSCRLDATRTVVDDGGYGFFATVAPMSLRDVVITRQLDAAGAIGRGTPNGSVEVIGDTRFDNADNAILRDVLLPSGSALPTPTPICPPGGC